MTPEEREVVVAIILEQAAITDRNILPDRRGSAGSDYTFGIVKGLKEAAEVVRNPPAAPAWIPVAERLPEPLAFVLVVTPFGSRTVASRAPDPGTWWADQAGYALYPTHWMPIPAPPEP